MDPSHDGNPDESDSAENKVTIEGDVTTNGGDFTGRDKHIGGDVVSGDKIEITNFNHYYFHKVTRIVLTIQGELESFSQKDQERLTRIIAEALSMNEPVTINKIEPGSIKVTIELPTEKAIELYKLVKSGQLQQAGITNADLIKTPLFSPQPNSKIPETIAITHESISGTGERDSRAEQDLLLRLKNGDEHAWAFVTQEYGIRLYDFLLKKLPNAEDVEDILMETMAEATRSINTFDEKASLSTFLFSLANRKRIDFYRRKKTIDLTDMVTDRNSGTASIEFQELLNSLRPEYREILLLRYEAGLGIDEIASLIGKNYKATESLLRRARQELRQTMGKEEEVDE